MPVGIAIQKGAFKRNRYPKRYRSQVKGAIASYGGRSELKYVDTVLQSNTALYDTTGLATAVNLLAVGDDNNTRDGRQVTIKSVAVNGAVAPLDAATVSVKARTMLVWDNATNSTDTTSTIIASVLTSANSCAFPTVANQNRYTILWDSHKTIGYFNAAATTAVSASPGSYSIKYYRKMNSITQYSGTTAAIGSIQNGALWFITIGDVAAGAGAVFNGQIRVRYIDA